jgi:hypothetical protein
VGVREIEARAMGRQPIEIRSRRAAAVRSERVRTQRVDRDEENVAVGVRRQGKRLAADPRARGQSNERRRGGRDTFHLVIVKSGNRVIG